MLICPLVKSKQKSDLGLLLRGHFSDNRRSRNPVAVLLLSRPMLFYPSALALLLAAEEGAKPLILRLDGAMRAKVLAALAGLIILGFLLIVLTWLGARLTRRYMGPKLKPLSSAPARDEEWARPPDAEEPQRKKKG
jgi:hypothetical protein